MTREKYKQLLLNERIKGTLSGEFTRREISLIDSLDIVSTEGRGISKLIDFMTEDDFYEIRESKSTQSFRKKFQKFMDLRELREVGALPRKE